MKTVALLPLMIVLVACATPTPTRPPASTAVAARPQPGTGTKFAQAATTPLRDLNMVRVDIPPVLIAAQQGPYLRPADPNCMGLATDIQALDAVLGPDLDVQLEQNSNAIGNAAVDVLRNTAEGVIPFRGWVRKLTGAERHSRAVAAAIAAGAVRRAYLKGLGQAAGC
jgi:hypothetical protein